MKVQTWLADDPESPAQASFELLHCPACSQMHFVNRRTGNLLGEKKA
ncbi:MAG: hypothetical protein QM576_00200 [Rhodopseudomonas sp.]|nr:hypothetical protein [Rhodopseudomonas sp. BR0M22]MCD0421369.1 hypothetical protein [Rubrivivax sp. JA1024]